MAFLFGLIQTQIRFYKFTYLGLFVAASFFSSNSLNAQTALGIQANSEIETAKGEVYLWPNGAHFAVNLSYDDALNSQLDNAIPVLNEFGIKGSFYLTLSSPVVKQRHNDWREIARQGHELGNHTIYHACQKSLPGREWVSSHRDLDKLSHAQIHQEVKFANDVLFLIDGKTKRTFTPPCGDLNAKEGNYVSALAEQFEGIKWQNRHGKQFDKVYMPYDVSGSELIKHVEQYARGGGALTIIFHGIGGDHLAVSYEAHRQLVAYLAQNPQRYWTTTYLNIMTYLNDQPPKG